MRANADGTFAVDIRMRVQNVGDEALVDVQVINRLADQIAAARVVGISGLRASGALSAVRPGFDGAGEPYLLSGNQGLAPGSEGFIDFTLTFDAAGFPGPFLNSAMAWAIGADSATMIDDISQNGPDTDPDTPGLGPAHNPNPEDNNAPTPLVLPAPPPESPLLVGLAKTATPARDLGDGRLATRIDLLVENFGEVEVVDLQLKDDLSLTFATAASFEVLGVPVSGSGLPINPGFDGDTDVGLLGPGAGLPIGGSATVSFEVAFDPGGAAGPFFNSALAWAGSPGGQGFDDVSTNGADPDPDGDGRPDEREPTPIDIPLPPPTDAAALGLAKAASDVRLLRDSDPAEYLTTLTFVVENLGPTSLHDLRVRDDLAATFADAAAFDVLGPPRASNGLVVNPAFDGVAEIDLLGAAGNSLAVGERATISVDVAFTPAVLEQRFLNTALATGRSPAGSRVEDISTDGADPDPNGDGVADESEPTPIVTPPPPAPQAPLIGLAKAATAPLPIAGTDPVEFATTLTFVIANLGPNDLTDVRLQDALDTTFADAAGFRVLAPPVADSGLVVNPSFDGVTEVDLLGASGNRLLRASQARVSVDVAVTPATPEQGFLNSATVSGRSDAGLATEDISTDGANPDPNGDGSPDESVPTPIVTPPPPVPTEDPRIGLAKQVGSVVFIDGSNPAEFRTSITLVVENLGDTELEDVRLFDNLAVTFAEAADFRVLSPPIADSGLVVNPAFDGRGEVDLLGASGNRLPLGGRAVVQVDVAVTPATPDQTYLNSARATGLSPLGAQVEDLSTDGLDPDPNGDGVPDEDMPSPIDPPPPPQPPGDGALEGIVFLDPNVDLTRTDGEALLAGWRVQVRASDGSLLAELVTDANGFYRLDGLPPGDYALSFLHPDTGVTWLAATVTVLENTTARQDLPVIPGGVVYDSQSRERVPGTQLALVNAATGEPLPAACLLPGQQNQIVGSDAAYRFEVLSGAAAECPAAPATYELRIVSAPSVYLAQPSQRLTPDPDALGIGTCPVDPQAAPPCVVQVNAAPPTGPDATRYFLQFSQSAGDTLIAHNHLPLDRVGDGLGTDLLVLQKSTTSTQVVVGDLVTYDVSVRNQSTFDLTALTLSDDIPTGFRLVSGTPLIVSAGADGILGNADDLSAPLASSGTDPVLFGPFDLAAGAEARVRYALRVGVGVLAGSFPNTVTPLQGSNVVGGESVALVEVVGDSLFEQTTVIGKVFHDRDGDNWQDPAAAEALTVAGGPFDRALRLPDLRGRRSAAELPPSVRVPLPGAFTSALEVRTRNGARYYLEPDGTQRVNHQGAMARGRSALDLRLFLVDGNSAADESAAAGPVLLIENHGVVERGLPGVRLATVAGLLIETDAYGRYHLADVDTGRTARGANFILKLDPATLPDGAQVLSENPRVLRLTPALMSRIDFAVTLPEARALVDIPGRGEMLEVLGRTQLAEVPPVRFDTGRSEIPPDYATRLRELLAEYADRPNLQFNFVGHADPRRLRGRLKDRYGDNVGLSEARAKEVAEFAQQTLNLPVGVIRSEGRGAREPVASNRTRRGMAQNRRVEIEVSWTEVSENTLQVGGSDALPSPGRTEGTYTYTRSLPPLPFASGSAEIDAESVGIVRRAVERFGTDAIRLNVIGHTDNVSLGTKNAARYGTNEALSLERAQTVAAQLREQFGLPESAVTAEGRGAAEPLADNRSAAGRAQNRRVEIQISGELPQTRELSWLTPVQGSVAGYLPGGGRVWSSEYPLVVTPKLDVLAAQPGTRDGRGRFLTAPVFNTYSNYAPFIQRLELRLFDSADTDLARPLTVVPLENATGRVELPAAAVAEIQEWSRPRRNRELAYTLRAYGAGNRFDETAPRLMALPPRGRPALPDGGDLAWGQSNLAQQSIVTDGSRVRVHGVDLNPSYQLSIDGEPVPIDANGSFVWERQMGLGSHRIALVAIDDRGGRHTRYIPVQVEGAYRFVVGLANVTVGQNDLKGNLEPLSGDDHFDETVFVDGRLALYAKAKIRGKYLLTAQLDSTEDELKNFTDNLKREDPRRLFRQLDPDRYYPVYGDDSTTTTDVDTQGAFYLRLDFDNNSALWGNYNTGLTDTEFTQYNRTLYGARIRHENKRTTAFGDSRSELTLFGSEAQSAAAHVTFAATGGSLYYLRHTDIVQGSEKVWIEVRRRDTEQVLDREVLYEGRDYEVDALQGRIILARPLSQVVNDRGPSIIRSTPLEGDDVFLLVDYEFIPDRFSADEITAGGRGKVWLGDHIGLGVSKVVDERDGNDYDLQGADITLKAGPWHLPACGVRRKRGASAAGGQSVFRRRSHVPPARYAHGRCVQGRRAGHRGAREPGRGKRRVARRHPRMVERP